MSAHPLTAVLTVSLIIRRDGKVLVLNERKEDGVLRKMLPGGHVDLGESVLDAVKREALEETGYEVEPQALVQVIARTLANGTHAVRQTFTATVKGGTLRTEPGVTADWLTPQEVEGMPAEDFNFGSHEALLLAFRGKAIDPAAVILRKGERSEALPGF